ncbi:hypothetical protein L0244_39375 [bacterium]|nr:hypothetical protein [bacterium]
MCSSCASWFKPTNLSIDKLRQRKRRQETPAWLPSPVPDEYLELTDLSLPSACYDFNESLSFAFLLAMEALSPSQRVILVLRDVLDLSVQETADLLEISQINVKVTLHRARKIMQAYDKSRTKGTIERLNFVFAPGKLTLVPERLKNYTKTVIHLKFMKVLLVCLLFLSFAECPSLLSFLEESHSVRFETEHGVFHVILFHSSESEESATKILTKADSQENHEFHFSTAYALIKKAVQTPFPMKHIPLANNYLSFTAAPQIPSVNLFESDIGTFSPPLPVLRI